MGGDVRGHYDRLASTYDENWAYSPDFLAWMTGCLAEFLQLHGQGKRVADIGCGTGLYAARLAGQARSVTCADPSEKMLEQVPGDPRLRTVVASAEDAASGRAVLPKAAYDRVVVKEAIHHVAENDRGWVIRGLAGLLAPSGRLVVAMLPTAIDYPLFRAAHERFQELQPDPEDVALAMREAGLTADVAYREFRLSFPKEQYLDMVRNRYMSLLSLFTDDELAAGINEIRRQHPEDPLVFSDRFAFVTGSAA